MVEYLVEGYTFSSPIRCGRTMILNGFIKYLENKYGKHLAYTKAEKHIEFKDVCKENWLYKKWKENLREQVNFKQEYESIWIKQKEE